LHKAGGIEGGKGAGRSRRAINLLAKRQYSLEMDQKASE